MKNLLAQNQVPIGTIGGGSGLGPFPAPVGGGAAEIAQVVSMIVGFITIVAGIFFLFQFLIGGIEWISSTGDKQKLEKAQNRLSYAFLGLVVVVGAYGFSAIVGSILGFDFLNPVSLINLIKL